ncbi:MAG: hypothetical protein M4579_006342 [Chaenotheca gracillima]|nr:MAG: hypothetical protein M4579_006342 [Chaenotheca gracillima]
MSWISESGTKSPSHDAIFHICAPVVQVDEKFIPEKDARHNWLENRISGTKPPCPNVQIEPSSPKPDRPIDNEGNASQYATSDVHNWFMCLEGGLWLGMDEGPEARRALKHRWMPDPEHDDEPVPEGQTPVALDRDKVASWSRNVTSTISDGFYGGEDTLG